jgi:hypothetical protein|tara:strand:- start:562 stop:852 length:291 start_codon:yes stop_codon:yes gene_type:complete
MEGLVKKWQGDEAGRAAWQDFILTPEFERGLRVLESQATPVVVMGESLEQTAKRQSFQAGFHTALHLIQRLPTLHFKKVQDQLPEWDYIQPIEEDE